MTVRELRLALEGVDDTLEVKIDTQRGYKPVENARKQTDKRRIFVLIEQPDPQFAMPGGRG